MTEKALFSFPSARLRVVEHYHGTCNDGVHFVLMWRSGVRLTVPRTAARSSCGEVDQVHPGNCTVHPYSVQGHLDGCNSRT